MHSGGSFSEPDEIVGVAFTGGGSPPVTPEEAWTGQQLERVAQQGFELRRRGERWELQLSMGGLDPPLTEAAMDRYCAWLRGRLSAVREEHGAQALRRCYGEVDFSSNGLSNQAVWILLETLAQHEVHASVLKLYKNRISQGGVLAVCEFLRANRRAGPVHELHLSHNEIDDESVLELMRTFRDQRSRYPPQRLVDGMDCVAPVWVRLHQNRIRDPAAALRAMDSEGITFCAARSSNGCGPTRCARPGDCPLVHLYLFADQTPRRRDREQDTAQGNVDSAAAAPAAPREGISTSGTEEFSPASRRRRGRRPRPREQAGAAVDGAVSAAPCGDGCAAAAQGTT